MPAADAQTQFDEYAAEAVAAIEAAESAEALEPVRVTFLGAKKGRLRELQQLVGKAAPEDRKAVGQGFNAVKTKVTEAFEAKKAALETADAGPADDFDVTLPGVRPRRGYPHPVVETLREFREIMTRLGFSVVDGPELEDEQHNFNALNIPREHPARDPLDNFYLSVAEKAGSVEDRPGGPVLLRSQTSTVQIRVMEQTPPPIRIVSLGRVYRPDTMDATHSCMFHQMEGLYVAPVDGPEGPIHMGHLKTVLRLFAETYLGDDVEVRFRPSFFPFTEPSVEVDMLWDGKWIEIGGAGMVDPNVFTAVGYDPDGVTGFAFGLGVERFAMRRYLVPDIREFYKNDLRFLRQF
ncbi:MAG: phenylalanine--tRNA ligase subunit alpha [Planctomycetota bacterium]